MVGGGHWAGLLYIKVGKEVLMNGIQSCRSLWGV